MRAVFQSLPLPVSNRQAAFCTIWLLLISCVRPFRAALLCLCACLRIAPVRPYPSCQSGKRQLPLRLIVSLRFASCLRSVRRVLQHSNVQRSFVILPQPQACQRHTLRACAAALTACAPTGRPLTRPADGCGSRKSTSAQGRRTTVRRTAPGDTNGLRTNHHCR